MFCGGIKMDLKAERQANCQFQFCSYVTEQIKHFLETVGISGLKLPVE